ncbi:hypothetical protein [Acanthopleuribacter pedis]|uniref:Uncharacterized protein n=1 Tax=Acanthopleuribacter pedis TaxID=442870 RepID=A0A8J7QLZ5_9BACT|nr:hypothetical protein [Acanthopleuribacter pedis]MBO1322100.1 hypothetical protein [Acanthopleuribacter pedis]
MKSYPLEVVFQDLKWDHVPLERVVFDASSEVFVIKAELETGSTKTVKFSQVVRATMSPCEDYDMTIFCISDFFCVTLYRVLEPSTDVFTFLFPTESRVWEVQTPELPILT